MPRHGKIVTVVGGQWGSEAKGQLIEYLSKRRLIDACIRTGSINAGHSVFYDGKKYAMQTVPAGWVDGGKMPLIIGAGAYIKIELLDQEIKLVFKALTGADWKEGDVMPFKLYIDPKAGLHTKKHEEAEAGLHERMGSTGKGCEEAIKDKMDRRFDYQNFGDTDYGRENDGKLFQLVDTCAMMNEMYDTNKRLCLEGTQGAHLDLLHGDYPYVTSRPTNAAQWYAEAGLSPALKSEVAIIVRTMPIRVAGNSGPLPGEMSWADAARLIDPKREFVSEELIQEFEITEASLLKDWQMPPEIHEYNAEVRRHYSTELSKLHNEVFRVLGPEKTAILRRIFEITTVTKKLRRIAAVNYDVLRKTARLNRPTYVHLTFLNYWFPQIAKCTSWVGIKETLGGDYDSLKTKMQLIEQACGAPIRYVGVSATRVIRTGKY